MGDLYVRFLLFVGCVISALGALQLQFLFRHGITSRCASRSKRSLCLVGLSSGLCSFRTATLFQLIYNQNTGSFWTTCAFTRQTHGSNKRGSRILACSSSSVDSC